MDLRKFIDKMNPLRHDPRTPWINLGYVNLKYVKLVYAVLGWIGTARGLIVEKGQDM